MIELNRLKSVLKTQAPTEVTEDSIMKLLPRQVIKF